MKDFLKKFAIALVALSAVATYAQADVGCYVGVSASATVASVKAEGVSISENGLGAGVLGGCAIAIDKFDIGGRLAYDWSKDGGSAGSWQAVGVLGYRLNDYVRPYALAGLAGIKIDLHDYKQSHSGMVAGAGFEISLSKNLALITEYNRLWANAKTFDDIRLDPGQHVVRIGVVSRF